MTVTETDLENIYKVRAENWYTAKPYGFKYDSQAFFLPISPNNLNVSTSFATNVVSTLYGTVEEHSEVRYFDISIQGTTGISPKYGKMTDVSGFDWYGRDGVLSGSAASLKGRRSFELSRSLKFDTGGFFKKTLDLTQKAYDTINDLVKRDKPQTGLYKDETGYLAFHNLYRFLLEYKKRAANGTLDASKRLVFFNYKDNVEYDVAIRGFSLTRSAEAPMLYNYTISMRGYNLRTIGTNLVQEVDELKRLGLDGVDSGSFLQQAKRISSRVKALSNAAGGLISNLGK
jgi:hypothetical protein